MPRRSLAPAALLLTAAVATTGALGPLTGPATAVAAAQPASTTDELRAAYGSIRDALEGAGGILPQDKPVVRALLARTETHLGQQPNDVVVLAIDLQVSLWLDEDPDRIADRYDRLVALRPADGRLAVARLEWLRRAERLDAAAEAAAMAEMAEQFPENPAVALAAAQGLADELAYDAVIAAAERATFTPADQPELQVLLAEALVAQHRFEEAIEAANQLSPIDAGGNRILAERIKTVQTDAPALAAAWADEQAIRASEASADDLPRVAIQTSKGQVVLELFENEVPNTVANFVALVRDGFYTGTRFSSFQADIQVVGGDGATKPGAEDDPTGAEPDFRLPDEFTDGVSARPHFRDAISMIRSRGTADSAATKFAFTHRPTPWLDDDRVVFGRVIAGLDVVRQLRTDDVIESATVIRTRDGEYVPTRLPAEVIPVDDPLDFPDSGLSLPDGPPPVDGDAGGSDDGLGG